MKHSCRTTFRRRTAAFAAALLAVSAAGCMAILPPGDPPAGGITGNGETQELSPAERRSRLATRIAASALPASPRWQFLVLECDDEALLPLAEAAAREAAGVAAFTVKRGTPGAPGSGSARLLGVRRGTEWEFTLLSPDGALLWRERFSAPER